MVPRGSNMAPRLPHDGPRWPQDGPKTAPRWPKMTPKMSPKCNLGAILVPSWGHLGAIFGHLGPSWASWSPLGAILVPSWGLLGSCKLNGSPKLVSLKVPLILLALFLTICKMCVSPRRNAHFAFNTAPKSAGHIDSKGRLGASGAILGLS